MTIHLLLACFLLQQPAFDVASIKPAEPGSFILPTFPLDPGPAFTSGQTNEAPHGRFSASFPLSVYISFAYKLSLTQGQRETMLANLPKWVATDRFTIQAHAEGNPTKDRMRAMMKTLLAERFHLAVHLENQEVPLFHLTLVKPGKPGPKLIPHSQGPSCDTPSTSAYPPLCDVMSLNINANRQRHAGSRNANLAYIADAIPSLGNIDRPVIDRTGLLGTYDFTLEWTPESTSPNAPEPEGPTFLQALQDQLGLKLERARGPVQTLVIDKVERPSAN